MDAKIVPKNTKNYKSTKNFKQNYKKTTETAAKSYKRTTTN